MSTLVYELKRDHKELAEALGKIKEMGVNSEEGHALLKQIKNSLLAHLAKEDKWLYPALWKEAESDTRLRSTLNIFATEMDAISKAALDFFKKYENGGEGIEFSLDFAHLVTTLKQRIDKEENVIYEKYNELELSHKITDVYPSETLITKKAGGGHL